MGAGTNERVTESHSMSALSERAEMIETQRQRLYDGINRIYQVCHGYCDCSNDALKQYIDEEFEASLRVIDLAVIRAGAFYAVEIKRLADKVCAEAERIEREGVGE